MAEYKVNYTQSNFTGGIIAAELYGRNDFNKVKSGLKQCVNWTIREAGGLEFRRGTEYIGVVPTSAGTNFKSASIDDIYLIIASDGVHWWRREDSGVYTYGKLNYPTYKKKFYAWSNGYFTDTEKPNVGDYVYGSGGTKLSQNEYSIVSVQDDTITMRIPGISGPQTSNCSRKETWDEEVDLFISPSVSKLQFTELQRRLYLYDGIMKLCQVKLDDSRTPYLEVTKFEGELPEGATIVAERTGTDPDPLVEIEYQYAMSVAKDEEHESIAKASGVVTANAELTDSAQGHQINITMSLPESIVSAGGKVLLYKKYQGKFYYLDSVFLEDFAIPEGGTEYQHVYYDKGQFSPDVSKAIKEKPEYLSSDGSIAGVTSIADYGQRIFMTLSEYGTNIIFTQVGNFDSLAYSELRNEDEAGYLEVPVSHYDNWCKVVAGLDLIFSTSYTISQIQGYGDLQLQTVLFDGFSKTVQPVTTRRSLIYTNSNNRNIYDLTYNEYGQYDGIDLTLLVKYIFETKTIKRLAFKDYPVKTIYVLCDDGDLYCLTYIKDQNIYAWYKIEHAGKIHDLLVINKDTEDEIYIVVQYDSGFVIERAYHRTDNIYMDSVVMKRRANIVDNKITGLPAHMIGKKVRVFDLGNNQYYGKYDNAHTKSITQGGVTVQIDDVDFDGYEVAVDGSIQLEDYIELTGNVLVGFPYYAVAETIPLEFSDQNGNSTIGRKKNITEAYLRYGDSRGLSYKTLGKEYDCKIPSKEISDTAEFLERGQMRLDVASEYKWDSTIKILQREPYPARIESITLGLHFNDKS